MLPPRWTQGVEACYSWNNTIDRKPFNNFNSEELSIWRRRSLLQQHGAPWLSAYVYPHPLVAASNSTPTPQPTSTHRLHQYRPRLPRPGRIRLTRPIWGSSYSRLSLHVQRKMFARPWEASLSPCLPMTVFDYLALAS
jgi:hypothetical protein